MRMAPVAAGRAHGAWSSAPRALSDRRGLLSSSHDVAATATVRFGARRAGGSRVILCLASGGGHPRDSGEWEPAGSPWDGRMVDEGMATLRRRIREVEDEEEEEPEPEEEGGVDLFVPPGEWTELERRHHGLYVAGVREALGILFALLVRARPGLGAGVVALVLLSVPASVLLVSAELVRAVHSISAAVLSGRM
ncbi:hypothetical protein CFC21_013148 [Triticum aestivum]|uniref:Uncharacterized protein n=3 Tax=Triticinae TaxID=1648030 RepID=A0A452ZK60_AEGTS|nr:uncharacterized protein LOC109749519 [Aegilops tauschii subsp. strangulata]XP_044445812.1 uncharacterized protein LOC123173005 [Triticum aestivum]KAF6996858.1 hypothetical protein CFC21_013148 [Triticum aestivum]